MDGGAATWTLGGTWRTDFTPFIRHVGAKVYYSRHIAHYAAVKKS
jgi:hypothetical protein